MTRNKVKSGLPKDHISHTQIKDYMACPRFYYLKYHEGKRPVDSFELKFGSLQHAVADRITKYIIDHKKENISFDDVKDFYDLEFKRYHFDAATYAAGRENMTAFALQTVGEKAIILNSELEVKYTLPGGGVIVARIDRLDLPAPDAIEVVEYKSSSLVPSAEEMERDPQGEIYCFLVANLFPEYQKIFFSRQTFQSRVDAETGNVRGGFKKKIQKDRVKLEHVGDFLQIIFDKIAAAKDWPANPDITDHCRYCPEKCKEYFRVISEAYDELKVDDINSVARRFVQLTNQKTAVESAHKKVKALVEKYFEGNIRKEIAVDDKVIFLSYHKKEAEKMPRAGYDFTKLTIQKRITEKSALESLKAAGKKAAKLRKGAK